MGLSRGDRIVEATFNSEVTINRGSTVIPLVDLIWMFLSLNLKKKLVYIHVNPERSFGGTNGEPPSEASQVRKGGSGGPPPENVKNLHCK